MIAIFHELVGAGVCYNYKTLTPSYGSLYDVLMYYNDGTYPIEDSLELITELKYSADQLVPELYDETKSFKDIDLLICWEPNEKAFKRFSDSYSISPVPKSDEHESTEDDVRDGNEALLQGVTHILNNNGKGIPVICLRDLLRRT